MFRVWKLGRNGSDASSDSVEQAYRPTFVKICLDGTSDRSEKSERINRFWNSEGESPFIFTRRSPKGSLPRVECRLICL